MPNDRLSLKVDLAVTGGAQADAASQSVQRLIDITQRSGATGERAAKKFAQGLEHTVSASTAASAAVQLFEGSIPITAVENFISKTLKAGPILQAAFPVAGAIALTGVLITAGKEVYELVQKFDPLHQAEKRAIDTTKALGSEISKLGQEIVKLNADAAIAAFGKIAGLNMQATDMASLVALDKRNTAIAKAVYDQQKAIVNWADSKPGTIDFTGGSSSAAKAAMREWMKQGAALGNPDARTIMAARKDTDIGGAAFTQLNAFELQQKRDELQHNAALRTALQAQVDANDDAVKKAADTQRIVDKAAQSARDLSLGPGSSIVAGYMDKATPEMSASQRASLKDSGLLAAMNTFNKGFDVSVQEFLSGTSKYFGDFIEKNAAENQRAQVEAVQRDQVATDRLNQAIRRQDSVEFGGMRDAVNRQVRSAGIDAQPGNALALAQQNYDLTMRELAAEWQRVKAHQDSYNLSIEANRLLNDVNAAEGERNDRFREYLAIQEGGLRRLSGSFLEAAFGGSQGISNFLKSNVERFATGAFENLAGHYSKQILGDGTAAHPGIIPHAKEGTFLGMLLKGLPGGPDQMKSAVDPLKTATTENTTKTGLNTQAVDKLSVALQAYQSGGGAAGVGASGSGLASAIAGALGPLDDLPVSAPGSTANGGRYGSIVGLPAGITDDGKSASGGMSAMGKVGTGAAIVAGGFGAYEGFKSGGAKGGLAGASSILGTAALIDPEPISKAILAGAALVTGFASSMLGDPKQARAAQIQKELDEARYHAPTTISKMVSTDGSYMDRDSRGNLRTSPFSGNPQTTNPYTTWNDGSPYEVPGSVKSPYGPPIIVINHNYQTGAIQAADAKSFGEMLDAHHQAVGDAAAKTLGTGHTLLAQRIQYVQR